MKKDSRSPRALLSSFSVVSSAQRMRARPPAGCVLCDHTGTLPGQGRDSLDTPHKWDWPLKPLGGQTYVLSMGLQREESGPWMGVGFIILP